MAAAQNWPLGAFCRMEQIMTRQAQTKLAAPKVPVLAKVLNSTSPPEVAAGEVDEIKARLMALIDSGRFRPATHLQVGRILAGLSRPAVLVLAGSDSETQHRIVECLLGEGLPELSDQEGSCLLAASEELARRRSDGENVFQIKSLPQPSLKDLSILLLDGAAPEDRRRAELSQAAKLADLCIWCARAFQDKEAALWTAAPDALREDALLICPAPDLPQGFAKAFHPETGFAALLDAIKARIAAGRRARLDHAALFLARYTSPAPSKGTKRTGSPKLI